MASLAVVGVLVCSAIVVGFTSSAPVAQTITNPLPFDLPAQHVLKGSAKKVFAVYHPSFPISLDNRESSDDYYSAQYLNPRGEYGVHSAYGGILRERPLPRAVDHSADWQVDDMKTEVSRATSAGLDGFIYDTLSLDGPNWDRLQQMLQASQAVDPKFKVMLMPDGTAPATSDVNELAAKLATVASNPALFRLGDGRLVISPFAPEIQGSAWWSNFVDVMKAKYGIPIAFVPCFLDYEGNAADFASFSYGFSTWGDRSPATNTAEKLAFPRDDAHSRGKIWMQSVAAQDARPRSGIFWESNNTENLRTMWEGANSGADWVQIPTWNDYSEGTEISPSTHTGWSLLDITSYYTTEFKQGTPPPIARDVLYLSHRIQRSGMVPSNQPKPTVISPSSSAARDTVEVLSFLTTPSNVTVRIGEDSHSYTAPAGVFAATFPLAEGLVRAQVNRSNGVSTEVISTFPIIANATTQDLQYYFASSGRNDTAR